MLPTTFLIQLFNPF